MTQRSLFRNILVRFIICCSILILIGIPLLNHYLSNHHHQLTVQQLKNQLHQWQGPIEQLINNNFQHNESLLNNFKTSTTRLTLINPTGTVILDSQTNPLQLDNHGHRPEILATQNVPYGVSQRYSKTTQNNRLYVAIRVHNDWHLRFSIPSRTISPLFITPLIICLILGILILGLSLSLILYIEKKKVLTFLSKITLMTPQFQPLEGSTQHSQELELLRQKIVTLATNFKDNITTLENEKKEKDLILARMIEGIAVLDNDRIITLFNYSAHQMLCADHILNPIGKHIQEIIRNTTFFECLNQLENKGSLHQKEITLSSDPEHIVQLNGIRLSQESSGAGYLLVFRDMTHLKQLERTRQDFVANVSHELKTPVTLIKGALETLSTTDINHNDKTTFLNMSVKHCSRLETLINDLLQLSELDNKTNYDLTKEPFSITTCINNAITSCKNKLQEKGITIQFEEETERSIPMNPSLMEQVFANLILNALQYSPENTVIDIQLRDTTDTLTISIIDEGCGILKEHQPLIFQRFYRVDSARSRQVGGTGLGLSIVKHIVQIHNGTIHMTSTPGKGSTFSVSLPKNP